MNLSYFQNSVIGFFLLRIALTRAKAVLVISVRVLAVMNFYSGGVVDTMGPFFSLSLLMTLAVRGYVLTFGKRGRKV